MPSEITVIRDCYNLALQLTRRVEKFPRHHRGGLGSDLCHLARSILSGLIRAKYASTTAKLPLLVDLNISLEQLRFDLRLAVDLRVMPRSAEGVIINLAHDVGTQIGGWIRSLRPGATGP